MRLRNGMGATALAARATCAVTGDMAEVSPARWRIL